MIKPGKMYQYYEMQKILPTYANFKSKKDFEKYEMQRNDLIVDKLKIPKQFFENRDILEFGPDSGENALVFAKWGAKPNLVEPNQNAIDATLKNFKKFRLTNQIQTIAKTDLSSFKSKKKYDFVCAEGFVHTIKPDQLWLSKFSELTKKEGLVLISYTNQYGAFVELLYGLIAIFVRKSTKTNDEYEKHLKKLFKAKWDSIPHTRSFDSWKMDVVESPYNSSLKYSIDAENLVRLAYKNKLLLHASWPSYKNKDDIYWHKSLKSSDLHLKETINQINHDQFSYFLGEKFSFGATEKNHISDINKHIKILNKRMDAWKRNFNEKNGLESVLALDTLIFSLKERNLLVPRVSRKLELVKKVFNFIYNNQIDGLSKLCNTDKTFISFWGMPVHVVVFRKGI